MDSTLTFIIDSYKELIAEQEKLLEIKDKQIEILEQKCSLYQLQLKAKEAHA